MAIGRRRGPRLRRGADSTNGRVADALAAPRNEKRELVQIEASSQASLAETKQAPATPEGPCTQGPSAFSTPPWATPPCVDDPGGRPPKFADPPCQASGDLPAGSNQPRRSTGRPS